MDGEGSGLAERERHRKLWIPVGILVGGSRFHWLPGWLEPEAGIKSLMNLLRAARTRQESAFLRSREGAQPALLPTPKDSRMGRSELSSAAPGSGGARGEESRESPARLRRPLQEHSLAGSERTPAWCLAWMQAVSVTRAAGP